MYGYIKNVLMTSNGWINVLMDKYIIQWIDNKESANIV